MRSYGKKKKSSPSGKSSRHKSPARRRSARNHDNAAYDLNGKGEITKWNCGNQDGRELKIYVENGCTDGLTAKPLREKYPQFKKYAYNTFNSALGNARKAFNTQVRNPAKCLRKY